MVFFHKPDQKTLEKIVHEKQAQHFSYTNVGQTFTSPQIPSGFQSNNYKSHIGKSDELFQKTVEIVKHCKMYDTKHSFIYTGKNDIVQGTTALIIFHELFIWTVNPIRIVFINRRQENKDQTFSLGAGTLPGHEEHGEECFTIRLTESRDVFYELNSFYRPARFALRIFKPLVTMIVKQFDTESAQTIKKLAQM